MQPTGITIQRIRRSPHLRIVKRGIYPPVYDSITGLSVMLGVRVGGAQTVGAEAIRYVRVFLRKHPLGSLNAASTSAKPKT